MSNKTNVIRNKCHVVNSYPISKKSLSSLRNTRYILGGGISCTYYWHGKKKSSVMNLKTAKMWWISNYNKERLIHDHSGGY